MQRLLFANIWEHVVKEYLIDYNILPNHLGYQFDFKHHQDNLEITCSGFNNQMLSYISEVMQKFINLKDEPNLEFYFDEARESLLWSLRTYAIDDEIDIMSEFDALIFTNRFQRKILYEQLQKYDVEIFHRGLQETLKTGHSIFYIYGNYPAQPAIHLVNKLKEMLKLKPTNVLEHPPVGVLDLVPGENLSLIQTIEDKTCEASASLFYFQIGAMEEDSLDFAMLRTVVKYM